MCLAGVTQLRISSWILRPPLRIFSVIVAHRPFGNAESPNPQALHMQNRSRIHYQLPIVRLSDRTELMPEKDRRRFLHRIIVFLIQSEASRLLTVPFAAHASSCIWSYIIKMINNQSLQIEIRRFTYHRVFSDVNATADQNGSSWKLDDVLPDLLIVVE